MLGRARKSLAAAHLLLRRRCAADPLDPPLHAVVHAAWALGAEQELREVLLLLGEHRGGGVGQDCEARRGLKLKRFPPAKSRRLRLLRRRSWRQSYQTR